jgi:hypothetical protein
LTEIWSIAASGREAVSDRFASKPPRARKWRGMGLPRHVPSGQAVQ